MSGRPLLVIGAGGFGRETLDVANSLGGVYDILGVLDDAPSEINMKRLAQRGVAYLGTVEGWLVRGERAAFAIGIGSPASRRKLADRMEAAGQAAETLVHPSAVIGTAGEIASGSVVCAGVQVSTNVRLGRHVHLNPHSTIGHDAVLEDFVSVNPAATISGECLIGAGALVGAGAVILQGLHVGAASVVGAAACVVHDVPVGATVKGVPAQPN